MQLSQSVKLKQKQSLVMTPQLQQAIKLLQLSNLELGQHLQEQVDENPFLELGDIEDSGLESAKPNSEKDAIIEPAISADHLIVFVAAARLRQGGGWRLAIAGGSTRLGLAHYRRGLWLRGCRQTVSRRLAGGGTWRVG